MIKYITVTNHLGESIKLELGFPEKSGFLIQGIDGLGPGKANINLKELATGDGSAFNSARIPPRNIIFRLQLLENPTVEATRQKTYKYFPLKKIVHLLIETDLRTCEIYGRVESNEPIIFSKNETTQISIICPDPYFYSAGEDGKSISVFYSDEPLFEFEFSNESLTGNMIEFGRTTSIPEQTIYYSGDSEVGVIMVLHALGAVSNITIHNVQTYESMKIDSNRLVQLTGEGLKAGDTITISTIRGNKYISLLRDGADINILNCLDRDADWFQLSKGDNVFAYEVDEGYTNLEFRIENQTIYEGV